MIVYNFHPITGEYLGESKAKQSPREPGVFLVPAFASDTPPPVPGPGEVAVNILGVWTVRPIPEPEPEPEPKPLPLPDYAAVKRWDKENGGIMAGGLPVLTDDRSKMMIMGARMKAQIDANFTTKWKTPGGFVNLTAADLIAVSDAVLAHVDHCFSIEADVLAGIEAGKITTVKEIDAAFAA